MKITLDIDKLLAEGKIDPKEYEVLKRSARADTTSLALNIFLGFGVIAVSVGLVAAVASSAASIAIGIVATAGGIALGIVSRERWSTLGSILVVVGSLIFGGGVIAMADGSAGGLMILAIIYGAVGLACKSALMIALSAFSLFGAFGATSAYGHARYSFGTDKPILVIIVFSALAAGANYLSVRLGHEDSRLFGVYARTCLIIANIGFWIGSLWGDNLFNSNPYESSIQATVPGVLFVVAWAAALVGLGVWAHRNSERWALNTAAVFGGIHLYTQWFERLGATPISLFVAGLLAVLAAYILIVLNRDFYQAPKFGDYR